MLRSCRGQDVGYGATCIRRQLMRLLEPFPLGLCGWFGPEFYKGFHVIVDGQLCPIVGRVSMDQITVRLPKVYPLGTPVTLMGGKWEQASLRQRWLKNVALSTTRSFVCLVIVYLVAMINININRNPV